MWKESESIYIDGKSVDIDNSSTEDLQKYITELKQKETVLITRQNDLLSKILG